MKKTRYSMIFVLLIGAFFIFPNISRAEGERAVEVEIFGGGLIDQSAVNVTYSIAGQLVGNGDVKSYTVLGYGIEGGLHFCLELSPYSKLRVDEVQARFESVQPNLDTTSYEVRTVEFCEE